MYRIPRQSHDDPLGDWQFNHLNQGTSNDVSCMHNVLIIDMTQY